MNVGLIGTGAIAEKHAQAYRNMGFTLALCTNRNQERGRSFAERHNTKFAATAEEVC